MEPVIESNQDSREACQDCWNSPWKVSSKIDCILKTKTLSKLQQQSRKMHPNHPGFNRWVLKTENSSKKLWSPWQSMWLKNLTKPCKSWSEETHRKMIKCKHWKLWQTLLQTLTQQTVSGEFSCHTIWGFMLWILDFYKIGGFCIILPCLNSNYAEVRSETALLVGELSQNNEFCQQRLLDLNILPKLIELMSDEAEVSSHAFHAISCIVRSYEPGMRAFVSMGGLECLLSLIQGQDREKLIIKSMFLINSFAQDSLTCRDDLIKLNAIEKIIATLEPKHEYNTRLEQTLAALTSLVEGDDAVRRCQNESLKLKERLNTIITMGDDKEECQVSRKKCCPTLS